MKVTAILLAVALSAASMWGQAMVGYAGVSSSSATAAAGSASRIGNSGMGAVQGKMSTAMGQPPGGSKTHQTSQATQQTTQRATQQPSQTAAHPVIHGAPTGRMSTEGKMANEMGFCKQGNCPQEKERAGENEAGKDATGKDVAAQQATHKQEMKITFVGARSQ